jgi:hypothetical protein
LEVAGERLVDPLQGGAHRERGIVTACHGFTRSQFCSEYDRRGRPDSRTARARSREAALIVGIL